MSVGVSYHWTSHYNNDNFIWTSILEIRLCNHPSPCSNLLWGCCCATFKFCIWLWNRKRFGTYYFHQDQTGHIVCLIYSRNRCCCRWNLRLDQSPHTKITTSNLVSISILVFLSLSFFPSECPNQHRLQPILETDFLYQFCDYPLICVQLMSFSMCQIR